MYVLHVQYTYYLKVKLAVQQLQETEQCNTDRRPGRALSKHNFITYKWTVDTFVMSKVVLLTLES